MRDILAADVMNPDVLTVRERMSIRELANFFLDNGISGAPVVDAKGRPVGVVSLADIAAAASQDSNFAADGSNPEFYLKDLQQTYSEEEIRDFHLEREGMTVGDVMTPSVYSVDGDARVADVASTMLRSHVHRLLVTNGEEIVGIISTSDLLGLLVDEK